MTDEIKRKRDELAQKFWDHINRNADTLHAKTLYKHGFDAGYAEAQAEIDQLRAKRDKAKDALQDLYETTLADAGVDEHLVPNDDSTWGVAKTVLAELERGDCNTSMPKSN